MPTDPIRRAAEALRDAMPSVKAAAEGAEYRWDENGPSPSPYWDVWTTQVEAVLRRELAEPADAGAQPFRREMQRTGDLFCWCVENLQKFPPAEGHWTEEVKRRLASGQKTANILAQVAGDVCSSLCPSTWKTGEPRPHCEKCRAVCDAIDRPLPVPGVGHSVDSNPHGPQWRDRPTVPGTWLDDFGVAWRIEEDSDGFWTSGSLSRCFSPESVSEMWYGPIPQPPETPLPAEIQALADSGPLPAPGQHGTQERGE